jgi:KDO2-lipid IV(A) lauroyltransferase
MREHFLDKPFWYRQALKTVSLLPPSLTYVLARCIAGLAYIFSPRDRRHVSHNFDLMFNGHNPPANRKLLLWRFFQNYGIYVVDFFRLLSMNLEESQAFAQLYEGRQHIDAALDRGRGAVLLTAHLGHWEIGGLGLRAMGYPVNVVALKHNTTFTNALINVMRMRHGIRIIEVEESAYGAIELVKALNRNEVVAVLGDRVFAADRSEVTTFFNRPVQLPVGPVLLAMAARAPIVPAFSIMEAPGHYRGVVEAPLELKYGPDRREALQHNLRQVASVFERYIRRYPDQWYIVDPL